MDIKFIYVYWKYINRNIYYWRIDSDSINWINKWHNWKGNNWYRYGGRLDINGINMYDSYSVNKNDTNGHTYLTIETND